MVKISKFDAVEYLDSEEMMIEYLTAAMKTENSVPSGSCASSSCTT